jgi:predicted MFS family arabinose efflux permease
MMLLRNILNLYRSAYGGLPKAAWLLALVMLINRSGAMVIPFMTVYLTTQLGFSLKETGWLMAFFGLGAITGSVAGGKLGDSIGHYKVQVWSLLISGLLYLVLMKMRTFMEFGICVYLVSTVAETFRPANAASVAYYNEPSNLTRAYSLNRLASNLGYAMGPALGGLLASVDFSLIFMADGVSSVMACGVIVYFFRPNGGMPMYTPVRATGVSDKVVVRSPYRDGWFLIFVFLTLLNTINFFQIFSTLPLYLKKIYLMPEQEIGLFMGLNGTLIVLLEMIIIYKIGERANKMRLIGYGVLLIGLGWLCLNTGSHYLLVPLSIAILSIGEIFTMPFMNVVTVSRSVPANRGSYLALYQVAYSAAHVLAPVIGTNIANAWNFTTLWYVIGGASILICISFWKLARYYVTTSS